MTGRAALVLSGGSARRFQKQNVGWQDKALAEVNGKPLFVHAVENVRDVVDEVIVCVNSEERRDRYSEVLARYGLTARIVIDEKVDVSGPTVGIMSGLHATQADYCLTIPCDMPFLKPTVANYLFNQAEGFEVTVPMWPDGRLETLNMTLHRQTAIAITETLCILKRARSDDIIRASAKTLLVSPLKEIRKIDPELKSFININSQEELTKLQTRKIQGPVKENVQLSTRVRTFSDLKLLRDGAQMLKKDDYSGAEKTFDLCKVSFEVDGGFFWTGIAGERKAEALLSLLGASQHMEPEVTATLEALMKGAFSGAAKSYQCEATIYEKNSCQFLLERALVDKAWAESRLIE
jgi:molybdenum cofactor guanylyltransferase